jgi:capsule polysaccharide export protein KpsE/RkpR
MSSTDQNPDVLRLESELKGLRSELSRMESRQGPEGGSAVDVPMGRLPEASVTYVRARREVKLQETLLEAMVRQLESAKLDEAKEGPLIQQVDSALPPDYKSKPPRALIIALGSLGGLLLSALGVIAGRYRAQNDPSGPQSGFAWSSLKTAWRWSARGSPRNPP